MPPPGSFMGANMSDTTLLISVEDLINSAMGACEVNTVNYKLLQTVLHILARQLRLLETNVEIRIREAPPPKEKKEKKHETRGESREESKDEDERERPTSKDRQKKHFSPPKVRQKKVRSDSEERDMEKLEKERAKLEKMKPKDREKAEKEIEKIEIEMDTKERDRKKQIKLEEKLKKMDDKEREKYEKEQAKLEKKEAKDKEKEERDKEKLAKADAKERERREKEKEKLENMDAKAKEKYEREQAKLGKMDAKEKEKYEKEQAKLEKMDAKEREKAEKEKEHAEKEKAKLQKMDAKEREQYEKEQAKLEKMNAKEREKAEKEKVKLEKMDTKEREQFEKEQAKLEKMNAKEREKAEKEKEHAEKEKAKLEKMDAKEREKYEKEQVKLEKMDAKEREKAEKEKEHAEKEKAKLEKMDAKEREKYEKEQAKLEKMDAKEREKAEKEKEHAEKEKEKLEKMDAKEREKYEKEQAKLEKMNAKEREKAEKEKQHAEKEKGKLEKMDAKEREKYEKEQAKLEKMNAKEREHEEKDKSKLAKMDTKEREKAEKEKVKLEKMDAKEREQYEKEQAKLEKMDAKERERAEKEKAKLEKMGREKCEKEQAKLERAEKEKAKLEKMDAKERDKYEREQAKLEALEREKAEREKEKAELALAKERDKKAREDKLRLAKETITVTEKDKILIVEKGPTTRTDSRTRVGSIEVVTLSQFELLQTAVNELKEKAAPLPMPALPDNKQLRDQLAKGTASLTDTMQAMQVSARVQAAEAAIERMAGLLTQLAAAGALPKDVVLEMEGMRADLDAVSEGVSKSVAAGAPLPHKTVAIDPMSRKPSTTSRMEARTPAARPSVTSRASAVSRASTPVTDCVSHPEMDDALRSLKDELSKNVGNLTLKATQAADGAATMAKAVAEKLDIALKLNTRIESLHSLVSDYAEQLSGFDAGLTTQMQSFQEQMVQMRGDLKTGITQLENVNSNSETAAVTELTERYEGLVTELDITIHAHQDLNNFQLLLGDELRKLKESVEMLREQKADRDEVLDGLRDKADNSRLAGLLTEAEFALSRAKLEHRLELCYEKFGKQDQVWMNALKELSGVAEQKAELLQLLAARDEVQEQLRDLQNKLDQLALILGEPKAAILTRALSKDGKCASCLVPALQEAADPSSGQPPRLPGMLPRTHSEEPPCVPDWRPPCPPDDRDHVCHRWVGGSHTLLGESTVREQAVPMQSLGPPTKRYTGYGRDGRLYQLEEDLQPCVECNLMEADKAAEGLKPEGTAQKDGAGDEKPTTAITDLKLKPT